MHPTDFGYRFKLSMYWGSKWKVYFALYYAFTYDGALAALDGYTFPVGKNKGWAIENLTTRKVYTQRYQYDRDEWAGHDEGPTEAFNQDYEDEPIESPPILLPAPAPPPPPTQQELFAIETVWQYKPPTKRRL